MTVLDRIVEAKREEVSALLSARSLPSYRSDAESAGPCRGFRRALAQSGQPVALIAEVKKASPVTGVLREEFDPVEIAQAFESGGAHCLSVLTDRAFFQGSPEILRDCRECVQLPVLRKDFTVDLVQVYEARAMGADAVLLIAEVLSDEQLSEFRLAAESLGMDALVEVHGEQAAERALTSGATMVGINNRDLRTFETRIDTSERVIPLLPPEVLPVSESSLNSPQDIDRVRRAGARAVLVGTAFSKHPGDLSGAVRWLMGWT